MLGWTRKAIASRLIRLDFDLLPRPWLVESELLNRPLCILSSSPQAFELLYDSIYSSSTPGSIMSSDILNRDLLPFHLSILEHLHDPLTSDLLLLARGLGLRKIVCTLMQIYDSPQNLVLLVNASPEEEAAIGEELGIMGCRNPGLRMVGYEMPKKDR